jgi:hypothetical protein
MICRGISGHRTEPCVGIAHGAHEQPPPAHINHSSSSIWPKHFVTAKAAQYLGTLIASRTTHSDGHLQWRELTD